MLAPGIERIIAPIWGIRDPAKRIVIVFACYLDEARTDKESALVTMAGYVAPYSDWLPFEKAAAIKCEERGVRVIHGYDLENNKKDFKGWDRPKKECFVQALQDCLKPTGAMGFAYSVAKAEFVAAKRLHKVMPNESAYGFCFRMIADRICNDPVMRMNFETIPGADISFILESGATNGEDARRVFNDLKERHPFRGRLAAFTFAPKDSTRSLQMADLLAFYSRRHIAKYDDGSGSYEHVPTMLTILHTGVHVEPLVAHDFKLNKVSAITRRRIRKPSWEQPS